MRNINLCEILEGHEGEKLYSTTFGLVTLESINPNKEQLIINWKGVKIPFNSDGTVEKGECAVLFPNDIDYISESWESCWKSWANNQDTIKKNHSAKTFDEIQYVDNSNLPYKLSVEVRKSLDYEQKWNGYLAQCGESNIENSVKALFQIYILIEASYGGNVSMEEYFTKDTYSILPSFDEEAQEFYVYKNPSTPVKILFHTREQAEDFIKYPENIKLLRKYFMI